MFYKTCVSTKVSIQTRNGASGEGSALRLFDTGVWCSAKVPIQTGWGCVWGGGDEGVRG